MLYMFIIYINNRLLFSHKIEGNSTIFNHMNEPGGHYDKSIRE